MVTLPKRRLYEEPLRVKGSNTTAEYVDGRVVPPNFILFVTHASLEDETTAPDTISFGKKVGNRFEAFEEEPSPLVGIRYHTDKTHHFLAGETPSFRVEGITANDILRGYLEGYLEAV